MNFFCPARMSGKLARLIRRGKLRREAVTGPGKEYECRERKYAAAKR